MDLERRNEFMSSIDLLSWRIGDACPPDEILVLFPSQVYGYALLDRKWFTFNINLVEDFPPDHIPLHGCHHGAGKAPTAQHFVKQLRRPLLPITYKRYQYPYQRGRGSAVGMLCTGLQLEMYVVSGRSRFFSFILG